MTKPVAISLSEVGKSRLVPNETFNLHQQSQVAQSVAFIGRPSIRGKEGNYPVKTNIVAPGIGVREPDVEAEITLFPTEAGGRQGPAFSGYRPGHKVRDDYITTGTQHFIERDELAPGETALGTITFITPEVYPHCLWVGQEIDIQEGSRVIGLARITKIYNPILTKVA